MAKYMFHTTYTGKGLVGLLKEGRQPPAGSADPDH